MTKEQLADKVKTATANEIAAQLRMYAADIEKEGRTLAPIWMSEAARRLDALSKLVPP
jgi:hypothetical protein